MKRSVSLLLAVLLLLSLAACSPAPVEPPASAPSAAALPEPSVEPAMVLAQCLVFSAAYLGLAALLRVEEFSYLLETVRGFVARRRS